MTKTILPKKFAKVFLNHDQEGGKRLKEFINKRIQDNVPIWKLLKKQTTKI